MKNPYLDKRDMMMPVSKEDELAYAYEQGYLAALVDARKAVARGHQSMFEAIEGFIRQSDEVVDKLMEVKDE